MSHTHIEPRNVPPGDKKTHAINTYNDTITVIENQANEVVLHYLTEYARQITAALRNFHRSSEIAAKAFHDTEAPARAVYLKSLEQAEKLSEQILSAAKSELDFLVAEAQGIYQSGVDPALAVRTRAITDAQLALSAATGITPR